MTIENHNPKESHPQKKKDYQGVLTHWNIVIVCESYPNDALVSKKNAIFADWISTREVEQCKSICIGLPFKVRQILIKGPRYWCLMSAIMLSRKAKA